MDWRIACDLGTNSLGTTAFSLRGNEIDDVIHLGSRIFSDGRDASRASNNMDRRHYRLQSRAFERRARRKGSLVTLLTRLGLAPADGTARSMQAALDPYTLRKRAIDAHLAAFEFGRVLTSLNRRRGFKSNRLEAEEDAAESGKIESGVRALEAAIKESGARTLGEYLYNRRMAGKPVRVRLAGIGKDAAYDIYPSRAMLEAEFDVLWKRQARHLGLTDADGAALRARIFHQRPLKAIEPGRCTFLRGEPRAAKAHPLAQRFEIVQKVNNLRYRAEGGIQECLAPDQRRTLLEALNRQGEMSFGGVRKLLGLRGVTFNLESEKMKKLPGNVTGRIMSDETRFGAAWWDLSPADQRTVVDELLSPRELDDVAGWLSARFGLDEEHARKTATARLPQGHVRLSLAALEKIVPVMETEEEADKNGWIVPITYDRAVKSALGLNHSDFSTGRFDRLPYYGVVLDRFCVGGTGDPDEKSEEKRYGRIPNPTVHVALNQVRRTVNELIERFGNPPSQAVLEIARDLPLGGKSLNKLASDQAANQKANEKRDDLIRANGLEPSGMLRLKLRLWEELDGRDPLGRACVYTGQPISLQDALSSATEIDHILPYRLTLDDGAANKILVRREANRAKARRTPHGAFGVGSAPGILPWDDILARAARLPENKRWRFSPDAMETFEAKRDFLDRQLVDTQYISRLARDYLMCLYDRENDGLPVWVIPGRLTAMIRGKLGLNRLLDENGVKNRADHRHHAVDAFVAGITERSFLQRIATAAGRADESGMQKLLDEMPKPFAKFDIEKLRRMLDSVIVSHKVDHGRNGRMHEETAYGILDPQTNDGFNLVRRKPMESLSDSEVDRIMDVSIRARLRTAVPRGADKKDLAGALARFSRESGIRRVKIMVKEKSFIAIKDRTGEPYKAVIAGDVQRIEVWQVPGEKAPRFIGVSRFDANRTDLPPGFTRPHRNARKLMAIHKGDTIAIDEDGVRRLMKVYQMSPVNKRLLVAEISKGGKSNSDLLEQYQFSTLAKLGLRKVHVSPTGIIKDGGPPCPPSGA